MGKRIYGVDIEKKVTPKMVRDAVILCFEKAHREIIDSYSHDLSGKELEYFRKMNVEGIVRKMFSDTGGDFDKPTKESLIKMLDALQDFASDFRRPEIIRKHVSEIKILLGKLK